MHGQSGQGIRRPQSGNRVLRPYSERGGQHSKPPGSTIPWELANMVLSIVALVYFNAICKDEGSKASRERAERTSKYPQADFG
jgi:hypothetical protein